MDRGFGPHVSDEEIRQMDLDNSMNEVERLRKENARLKKENEDLKNAGYVPKEDPGLKDYEVEVGRTVRKTKVFKVKAYTPDEACTLAHHQAYDTDFNAEGKDDGDPDYETMNCEEVDDEERSDNSRDS
jgi:hypothetical protein